MPREHVTLGSEHPLCDSIQMKLVLLFFVVWIADTIGFFFGVSTILIGPVSLPWLLLLIPAVLSFVCAAYLISKSHEAIFDEASEPRLVDSGVFSRVRHPMYLGTLLACLTFFFAMPSLLCLAIWIGFFIFYDRMATYEENDLIRVIGEEYAAYQKRVPKWLPRLRARR